MRSLYSCIAWVAIATAVARLAATVDATGKIELEMPVTPMPFQPPGIDYLGAGYDLVFGNPDGSEASMSVTDPGFRLHIVNYHWDADANTCSGIFGNWTCPKEATLLPAPSCMQQSSSNMISSTRDFQRTLQQDARVSGSVKGGFGGFKASASFSGSKAMAAMDRKISKEKTVSLQSKAVCIEYIASLQMGLNSIPFDPVPAFRSAVNELPNYYNPCFLSEGRGTPCPQRVDNGFGDLPPVRGKRRRLQEEGEGGDTDESVNECACDRSVISYFRFIQMYGTHYTTRVEMGGKIIRRVEMKESDASSLRKRQVDVSYGASIKASYKKFLASASAKVKTSVSESKEEQAYNAVMSVASKEVNINVGGSPSDDWKQWAVTAREDPMPVRYSLAPLADLVGKRSHRKQKLFEKAVADYIAAYGRTVTVTSVSTSDVIAVEIRYKLHARSVRSATFRVMIGETGDMIPMNMAVTKVSGSFRVPVPKQCRSPFDSFRGDVPITIEYINGNYVPRMLMEANNEEREEQNAEAWTNLEADFWKKKKKRKKRTPAPPPSIILTAIQPFAVMSDGELLPLDHQFAGKKLVAGHAWPINPMD